MTEEQKSTIEILLANRLYAYSLLYKVLGREPNAELMTLFTAESAGEAFALLGEGEDTLSKVPAFLEQVRGDLKDETFLEEAKNEYTRLFVGPVKLIAPPWESVYIGKEDMLFSATTLAVREFYKSYGLMPEGYPRVADDSLALELAFMTKLAERANAAFAAGETDNLKKALTGSRDFLKKHMLVWVPKFFERMQDSPSTLLYPQVCLILNAFIEADKAILDDILELV